jgi:hypothetical protein
MGGTITHGKRIAAAMTALATGQVGSKQEAAALVGINEASLSPGRLHRSGFITEPANQNQPASLLDITITVTGQSKTAREVFACGTKSAIVTLDKHAPNVGKLKPNASAEVKQAQAWLKMCKDFGLFRDDSPAAPPAELANVAERAGSVDWYLRNASGPPPADPADPSPADPPDGETLTLQAATGHAPAADAADPGESSPAEG